MDDQGTTPFEYAFLNRHRAVTELLTARGIAFSGENSGRAALAKAARDGDAEGVRFLLGKGVDVNSLDRNGLTPLQLAINRRPIGNADAQDARTREEVNVVELLLTAGANVEVRGNGGQSTIAPGCQVRPGGRGGTAARPRCRSRCAQRLGLDTAALCHQSA